MSDTLYVGSSSTLNQSTMFNMPNISNLTIEGTLVLGNHSFNESMNVRMISGSVLSHNPNNDSQRYMINISAVNFTIETGALIEVQGSGYSGGYGPGTPSSEDYGGGYGGLGSKSEGIPYGSLTSPLDSGSGGEGTNEGAYGAGVIHLNISDTLTVDGIISANGSSASSVGAGAGGSVYLITNKLEGSGNISARGGFAPSASKGAGAGGRIALYYKTDDLTGDVDASGGKSYTGGYSGFDGSVFRCNYINGVSCRGTGGSEVLITNGNIEERSLYSINDSLRINKTIIGDWTNTTINWTEDSSNVSTIVWSNVTGLYGSENYTLYANNVSNKTFITNASGFLSTETVIVSSQVLGLNLKTNPTINSVSVNATITLNGNYHLEADVSDTNLNQINFTIWNQDGDVFRNEAGTDQGSNIWNSPDFTINKTQDYNYSVYAYDNDGNVDELNATIVWMNLGLILNETVVSVGDNLLITGDTNLSNGSNVVSVDVGIFVNDVSIFGFNSTALGDGSSGYMNVTEANTTINNYTYLTNNESAGNLTIRVNDATEFAANDEILIIQIQNGTGLGSAGQYEFADISSIDSNIITLSSGLVYTYGSGIFNETNSSVTQVVKVPQFTNVTIAEGASIVAPDWDGYIGGIVVFRSNRSVNNNGFINVSDRGFRHGTEGYGNNHPGGEGEGIYGRGFAAGTGGGITYPTSDNNGGAGGQGVSNCGGGGGGGGHAFQGEFGATNYPANNDTSYGGYAVGSNDMSYIFFGGAGGGGGDDDNDVNDDVRGGDGAGIVMIFVERTINLSVFAKGESRPESSDCGSGEGAGGAGGSIYLTSEYLDVNELNASGGGDGDLGTNGNGGDGSVGRIRLDYTTLTNNTINPTQEYDGSFANTETLSTNASGYYSYTYSISSIFSSIKVNATYSSISGEATQSITVAEAPTVTLNTPGDVNYSVVLEDILFNCSATDSTNEDLDNITFYHNLNGSWVANGTEDVSGGSADAVFIRNISDFNDGLNVRDSVFNWTCVATDETALSTWGSANNSFGSWDLGTYTNTSLNLTSNFIGLAQNESGRYENSTGTYTSRIIDVGTNVSWQNISWSETIPYDGSTMELNVSARACADSTCSGDSWTGFGGNATAEDISSLSNSRYIQYKMNFLAVNDTSSPEISWNSVVITYGESGNSVPTVNNLLLNSTSSSNYTNATLQGYFEYADSDNDEQVLNETKWTKDDVLQEDLINFTSVNSGNTSNGQVWKFSVRLYDGTDWSAWSNNASITIANAKPEIVYLNISISGSSNLSNSSITLNYSADDLEGDDFNPVIYWYVDGSLNTTFSNLTFIGSGNTTKDENWTAIFGLTDNSELITDNFTANTDILNAPPELTSFIFNVSGSSNYSNSSIQLNYSFTDLDSDAVSPVVYWYVDNSLDSEVANYSFIGSGNTSKGENWTAILSLNDGNNYSGNLTDGYIVANALPELTSFIFNVSGSKNYTNSSIQLNYSFTDLDSDAVSPVVYWYKDSGIKTDLQNDSFIGSGNTSKGQNWTAILSLNDGEGYSDNLSYGFIVRNAPPELDSLLFNVSGSENYTNSSVQLNYSVTDLDSDDLRAFVYWYKDSVLQTNIKNVTFLQSVSTSKDQNWTAIISITDGSNSSTNLTGDYTVRNSPPELNNLLFNVIGSLNYTNSSVQLNYTFTDIDSDAINPVVYWYKDSTLNDSLWNYTFLGSGNTTRDENWTAILGLNDGENYSNNWSYGFTVQNARPVGPNILSPLTGVEVRGSTYNISWTAATDLDTEIGDSWYYNLTLYNSDRTFNQTIVTNLVAAQVNYTWNTTGLVDANYRMNISVTETGPSSPLTNSLQSGIFNLFNGQRNVTITSDRPNNGSGIQIVNFIGVDSTFTNNSEVTECQFIFNGSINQTTNTFDKQSVRFNLTKVDLGRYEWYVNCSDVDANYSSGRKTLIVMNRPNLWGGNLSNFSALDFRNVTNLVLDNPGFVKMNFTRSVNLLNVFNLTACVNLSNNRIEVNGTKCPDLNVSTELSFVGVDFTDPQALKDGVPCNETNGCTEVSYTGGEYVFNVTGFTVYSVRETPTEEEEEEETTTTTTTTTSGAGGGGGGGGGGGAPSFAPELYEPENFSLSEDSFTFDLAFEESREEVLVITNELSSEQEFDLSTSGIGEVLTLSEYEFTLEAYETKEIILYSVSDREPGLHVGKLRIKSDYETKDVPIVVEIASQLVLFDASIFIPSEFKELNSGDTLETEITLFNVGSPRKVDVLLNYRILDLEGNTVLEESETIAVQEQLTFNKEFYLPSEIEMGTYVLGLEVIYVNSVAVSSSMFDIISEEVVISGVSKGVVVILISLVIVILLLGIVMLLRKRENV